MTVRLGVDTGGTGIKAAPVDLEREVLVGDRQYVATPHPATPAALAELVDSVATDGRIEPAAGGMPSAETRAPTRDCIDVCDR